MSLRRHRWSVEVDFAVPSKVLRCRRRGDESQISLEFEAVRDSLRRLLRISNHRSVRDDGVFGNDDDAVADVTGFVVKFVGLADRDSR